MEKFTKTAYGYDSNEVNRFLDNIIKQVSKMVNLNQSSIDGINIFNSKDPFFNDICYIYKSKDGTDITLKDRRIDFYISKSLCNEDCSISKVNVEELYFECLVALLLRALPFFISLSDILPLSLSSSP